MPGPWRKAGAHPRRLMSIRRLPTIRQTRKRASAGPCCWANSAAMPKPEKYMARSLPRCGGRLLRAPGTSRVDRDRREVVAELRVRLEFRLHGGFAAGGPFFKVYDQEVSPRKRGTRTGLFGAPPSGGIAAQGRVQASWARYVVRALDPLGPIAP